MYNKTDANIETTMTMTYEDTTTHTYFMDDGNEASVIYSRNIDQRYDYTQETREARNMTDVREAARESEDKQLQNNKDNEQMKLAINKLTSKVYTEDEVSCETLPKQISSAPISKIKLDHLDHDNGHGNNNMNNDDDLHDFNEASSIVYSSREIILASNENLLLDEIRKTKQNNANNH